MRFIISQSHQSKNDFQSDPVRLKTFYYFCTLLLRSLFNTVILNFQYETFRFQIITPC